MKKPNYQPKKSFCDWYWTDTKYSKSSAARRSERRALKKQNSKFWRNQGKQEVQNETE